MIVILDGEKVTVVEVYIIYKSHVKFIGACPYDEAYVEPDNDQTDPLPHPTYLECSGKGKCDRDTGICQCYSGYEGTACQRMSCPNGCSGHGICLASSHLDINTHTPGQIYYDFILSKDESSKSNWDNDQSYACVCDKEYTGYDCSMKKCPTGYIETSNCMAQSLSQQGISWEVEDTTAGSTELGNACLAYLEYTDMYDRKYYSDRFCVDCQNGNSDKCKSQNVFGWEEALLRLPVGTIDIKPENILLNDTSVIIIFNNQQTGRQHQIKILTHEILQSEEMNLYMGVSSSSGYHGMTLEQLYIKDTETATDNDEYLFSPLITKSITYLNEDSLPPTVCSRNGICDYTTGICECFTGFYGIACTEQAALV